MPFPRKLFCGLLATLGVTGVAIQTVVASPLRDAAALELARVQTTAIEQAQARLPQFDQPRHRATSPHAGWQVGGRLDHSGRRAATRPVVLAILKSAAARHQLDPKLVLALSYWESGWDQSKVSATGAIGLMQVEPPTAAEAGPTLLGRPVDVTDPVDNAEVGAAILREDLTTFGSPELALAAYYQGPTSLRNDGMLPDTQAYVGGILALASRLNA
ncbi:MAG: lytic transglycosylase domain-containing protein [Candidatus Dormibacter sp.]